MQFHLLGPNDEHKASQLASMHHLRWQVFVRGLGWTEGLDAINCMEYDRFDRDGAKYLVHLDDRRSVTATMRFLPTVRPYMIEESFSNFVSGPCPKDLRIEELTRFASRPGPGERSKSRVAMMIAGAIEYGLSKGLTHLIGINNLAVQRMTSDAGWDPVPLGPVQKTLDGQSCVVCLHSVSDAILQEVRRRNGIEAPVFVPDAAGIVTETLTALKKAA